jgi:hypothetical protein
MEFAQANTTSDISVDVHLGDDGVRVFLTIGGCQLNIDGNVFSAVADSVAQLYQKIWPDSELST